MVAVHTRYAVSDGYSIAYQCLGDGPHDLLLIPGFVSNVEVQWEIPPIRRFLERLASFSRLVVLDKRGTGLSDRVPIDRLPSLEARVADVVAVMDDAGVEQASLLGVAEGGAMAVLLAAKHPGRVRKLVLFGSYAHKQSAAGDLDQVNAFVQSIEAGWGTGTLFTDRNQSIAGDPAMRSLLAKYERHCASPQAAAAIVRMGSTIDVSGVLDRVVADTLVLHRSGDPNIHLSGAEALAEGIDGARLVRLPGVDHMPFFGDTEAVLTEIEGFLTGVRPTRAPDRGLATILFVDMVDSTRRVARLGNRRWRDLQASFFDVVAEELARHEGTEIGRQGDGSLATFPGPRQAVRCAGGIRSAVASLGIEVRSGIHTGEIERRGDQISGLSVHIGARVGSAATAGEIWVSRTVRDLLAGSDIVFDDRGAHSLKGLSEPWRLYAVGG